MKLMTILIFSLMISLVMIGCEDGMQPTEVQESGSFEGASLMKEDWGWQRAHEELAERFLSAISEKDLDKFMSCWWNSPDVTLVLENGTVVQGWENIRNGMEFLMGACEELNVEVHEITKFRVDNTIYSFGTATWTRVFKPEFGGQTEVFTERWTDTARKINGQWVYIIDHAHDLTPF